MNYRHLLPNCFLLLTIAIPAQSVRSQDWVKQMFETSSHDFGNVPRGAKAEYEFVLSNKYQEDLHIAQVRSSCGCTTMRLGS